MRFCGICETEKINDASMSIIGFELKIHKDELTITQYGKTQTVKYVYFSDINTIEFEFKGEKYKFKIISTVDNVSFILKSEDGNLLFMKKNS